MPQLSIPLVRTHETLPVVGGILALLICIPAPVQAADSTHTLPAATPSARGVVTTQAAEVELRQVFTDAISQCTATVQQVSQQLKLQADPIVRAGPIQRSWRPSALPGLNTETGAAKHLSRSDTLENLSERLGQDSRRQPTAELQAYAAAAVTFLDDPDPAYRGIACAFLGLLGSHAAELGLLPKLAARLGDRGVALKALEDPPVPQQVAATDRAYAPHPAALTVGDLAQMALAGTTNLRFDDPETFGQWWAANGEFESRLWYWSLRWSRQGGVDDDLPHLFARNPRTALLILLLVGSDNCRDNEAKHPWPDWRPAAGRHMPQEIGSLYFAPPNAAAVAALVQQYQLRPQLLEMAVGNFAWADPVPDYDREHLAVERVMPILAAASTKAEAAEMRGLLKGTTGLIATSAKIQVSLTLLAAALDADNAPAILLEQLGRNPALPALAADLVARTGTAHWAVIKASYTHPPAGDSEGDAKLIAALAALKPSEARARLVELLEADPLDVVLGNGDQSTERSDVNQRRFLAFVKAAQTLNAGQPVLDAPAVNGACVYIAFKIPADQMAAYHARNRQAVTARRQAVAKLLTFFRTSSTTQ